ncbi:MAG: sensor histidine kinase, partial [Flavobacteriales bacterium]
EARIVQTKIAMHETLYRQRDELRKMNERLQCANKQLEEYVYIVSHDLKAPLRGLSSLAQFIEDELGEAMTTEVFELLSMMKSRTDRMQQMVDGILHYSRMANNRVDPEPVDLKLLINNIIDLICPPANVRIEYPDEFPLVEMEKIKIHEVLQNLILNGIKHNDKPDIHIQIHFRDVGHCWEFAIKDNGKGIKPEHQEKVFGLFQTLLPKDKSEGTGLGLTIVKKIVEQQDGKVMVESDWGKGTTFRFTWKK